MSKSILVIDTPENCNECLLSSLTECDYGKEVYCILNGEILEDFACRRTKPDWCPLLDLPEKMPEENARRKCQKKIGGLVEIMQKEEMIALTKF